MKQPELTPLDVLKRARAILAEPGHWCQGSAARDAMGAKCDVSVGYAFCLRGALAKAGGHGTFGVVEYEAQDVILEVLGSSPYVQQRADSYGGLVSWNDDPLRTREEVVAALDAAITLAEATS